MANPRQRRKQKSGTAKVKQSRRQQDKLKKIVVRGPPALVRDWNPRRTAAQNYHALGLAHKHPLALRPSGGVEMELVPIENIASTSSASISSDEDSDDDDSDEHIDGDEEGLEHDHDRHNRHAGLSQRSDAKKKKLTSRDIPKGFARIERDATGIILRVVMSAYDQQEQSSAAVGNGEVLQGGGVYNEAVEGPEEVKDFEKLETPWGKPLNIQNNGESSLDHGKPVEAKNKAIRDLEARSLSESSSRIPRFASNAELEVLRRLVQKHGDNMDAMSRDIKLNRDQKTKGQLKRQLGRVGGFQKLLA